MFPLLFFGKPVNVYVQLPLASGSISCDLTGWPSANKFTVILSGLVVVVSSTQVLLTVTSVVAGVCLFVIVVIVPSLLFPVNV